MNEHAGIRSLIASYDMVEEAMRRLREAKEMSRRFEDLANSYVRALKIIASGEPYTHDQRLVYDPQQIARAALLRELP